MCNLQHDTNESIYETEPGTQNLLVAAKREGLGGGMAWEGGIADVNFYIEYG